MKLKVVIGSMIAGLVMTTMATVSFAQNGPGAGAGAKGRGYGGPPASPEERAARQQACPQQNGDCPSVCPNGGQGRRGQGMGNGNGNGARRGLRDGTGPRNGTGNCPATGKQ